MNEIKKKLMGMTKESNENGCEGFVGFGEEDIVVCENECHIVLEDTCLNQNRYGNNDECEVVTRLPLKHGTVLQGDENKYLNNSLYLYIGKKRSN